MLPNKIHPTAVIESGAKLHESVQVGPYSIVGAHVEIGEGSEVGPHVVISGHTTIGKFNKFHAFCSIGGEPQDISYKGEPTKVQIGDHNTFREYVSVNRGTLKQAGVTIIGSHGFFMTYTHMGHDVQIGDYVRVVNSCNFAGHVTVGERAIISGGTNISQFVTIGRGAFIGGGSAIDKDVPCFSTAYGNRVQLKGINIVGLKRMGFEKNAISEFVDFYRTMESSPVSPKAYCLNAELLKDYAHNPMVNEMVEFIKNSQLGLPPFMS
jgi:UDP-N-acetylglucosamine acyltransferase